LTPFCLFSPCGAHGSTDADEAARTVRQLQAQLEDLRKGLQNNQAEAARLREKLRERK
jgi:hypothetical protein